MKVSLPRVFDNTVRCLDPDCIDVDVQTIGIGELQSFALDDQGHVVTAYSRAELDINALVRAVYISRCDDANCTNISTQSITPIATRIRTFRPAIAVDVNGYAVAGYKLADGKDPDFGDELSSPWIARCVNYSCTDAIHTVVGDSATTHSLQIVLDSNDLPVLLVDVGEFSSSENQIISCLDANCLGFSTRAFCTNFFESLVGTSTLAIAADNTVAFAIKYEGMKAQQLWRRSRWRVQI